MHCCFLFDKLIVINRPINDEKGERGQWTWSPKKQIQPWRGSWVQSHNRWPTFSALIGRLMPKIFLWDDGQSCYSWIYGQNPPFPPKKTSKRVIFGPKWGAKRCSPVAKTSHLGRAPQGSKWTPQGLPGPLVGAPGPQPQGPFTSGAPQGRWWATPPSLAPLSIADEQNYQTL